MADSPGAGDQTASEVRPGRKPTAGREEQRAPAGSGGREEGRAPAGSGGREEGRAPAGSGGREEQRAPAGSGGREEGRARGSGNANRRRGLGPLIGANVLGAALALSAAPIIWLVQDYGTVGRNRLTLTGSQASPAGIPFALLALAGLAAAFASSGWLRRAIGFVVAAAAIVVGAAAISVLASPPATAQHDDLPLPAPANLMGPVAVHPVGPVLALLGALLILASGALIMAGVGARRLAARYDAPGTQRQRAAAGPAAAPTAEESATDWWKALDVGRDPTVPPIGDAG